MDTRALFEIALELGQKLQEAGAEIFRVEESLTRLFDAYKAKGDVFTIPNCLMVSMETSDGQISSRIKRITAQGTNIEKIERYNDVARKLCATTPDEATARKMIAEAEQKTRNWSLAVRLIGYCLGAGAFTLFFGGNWADALIGALCGLTTGLTLHVLTRYRANMFFKNIIASFFLAVLAYLFTGLAICRHADATTIGALMILVPGLACTNAIRNMIYGDMVSGMFRIGDVLLTAVAIVVGTAAAHALNMQIFPDLAVVKGLMEYPMVLQCLFAFIACIGFSLTFNIHGAGMPLCALGGALGWLVYLLVQPMGGELIGYFAAALFVSVYSELMARLRKVPATAFLTVSIFPLVPGAGVFYSLQAAFEGDLTLCLSRSFHTVAIAGCLAAGILMASTIFRMWSQRKKKA